MACAVVEHQCGKKTHHTNVVTCSLGMRGRRSWVKLALIDGSVETIESGVSVKEVDDKWWLRTQLGMDV